MMEPVAKKKVLSFSPTTSGDIELPVVEAKPAAQVLEPKVEAKARTTLKIVDTDVELDNVVVLGEPADKPPKEKLQAKRCPWPLRNFVAFAILFSLSHGCLASVLSIAPAELHTNSLGSYSLGVMFVCIVVMALFFSAPVVDKLGSKWAMVVAMCGMTLYVSGFLGAYALDTSIHPDGANTTVDQQANSIDSGSGASSDSHSVVSSSEGATDDGMLQGDDGEVVLWITAIVGSMFGGTGAGLIWSAQGPYFRFCAAAYADQHPKLTRPRAMSIFAGIFAAIYLTCECAMKMAASALWNVDPEHGPTALFGTYISISFVCTILLAFLQVQPKSSNLPVPGKLQVNSEPDAKSKKRGHRFCAALQLCTKKGDKETYPAALLLAPKQVSWGMMTALVAFYLSAVLVKDSVGAQYIGYLSAIIPASAGILQLPLVYAAKARFGREAMMIFGDVSLLALAAVCFVLELEIALGPTDDDVPTFSNGTTVASSLSTQEASVYGHLDFGALAALFLLQGVGRATFEGGNRATYADVFKSRATEAFAGQLVAQGISSTLAFIVCPLMPNLAVAAVAVFLGILAIPSLLVLYTRSFYKKLKEPKPDSSPAVQVVYVDEVNMGFFLQM